MAWAKRLLAALVLAGVLADASACIVSFARVEPQPEETSVSMLCPCGCKAHTGAGIGLTQLAAAPAEIEPPPAPQRVAPWTAAPASEPEAPARGIDHVPILAG